MAMLRLWTSNTISKEGMMSKKINNEKKHESRPGDYEEKRRLILQFQEKTHIESVFNDEAIEKMNAQIDNQVHRASNIGTQGRDSVGTINLFAKNAIVKDFDSGRMIQIDNKQELEAIREKEWGDKRRDRENVDRDEEYKQNRENMEWE